MHSTPPNHSTNSQLAVRPNANQHLRVAPHSRLQERQRPVAHLPLFLSGSSVKARVSVRPSSSDRRIDRILPQTNSRRPLQSNNLPAEQSHTLCMRQKKNKQARHQHPIRDSKRALTGVEGRGEGDPETNKQNTHVHSLRGFWSSALVGVVISDSSATGKTARRGYSLDVDV